MTTEPKFYLTDTEVTINLNAVASVEWDDYYFEAEIKMVSGESYTISERYYYQRLAAILGHTLPDKPGFEE